MTDVVRAASASVHSSKESSSSASFPSSSRRERSTHITAVSALTSPSEHSQEAEERDAASSFSPPAPVSANGVDRQPATRAVVETLSDAEDAPVGLPSPPTTTHLASSLHHQATTTLPPPPQNGRTAHLSPADYADRRRLLNHITYLSTQLQRSQLQVEDLTRTVCILRGLGDSRSDAGSAPVRDALATDATTAAVLAAHDEREVHAALHEALAVFDPVIAQEQIYRQDDALAQVSLLREAELTELRQTNAALQEHRTVVHRLTAEVEHFREKAATLEQQKQQTDAALAAATLELQHLRHEEVRLNQRVVGLEELTQDGAWMGGVRVVRGAARHQQEEETSKAAVPQLFAQLVDEEQHARQALLQGIFWEPVLIAFDAGVTWITDTAALRSTEDQAAAQKTPPHPRRTPPLSDGQRTALPVTDVDDRLSLVQAGIAVDVPLPPMDADLLLLRRQQEEVTQLRSRLQLLQERNRVGQLEAERLQFLYESEVRRSERMAKDHVAQLQQAYDEVVKDRQYIMDKLRQEVEVQLRHAFEDGRAYERNSVPQRRRRRSQQPVRPSSTLK